MASLPENSCLGLFPGVDDKKYRHNPNHSAENDSGCAHDLDAVRKSESVDRVDDHPGEGYDERPQRPSLTQEKADGPRDCAPYAIAAFCASPS